MLDRAEPASYERILTVPGGEKRWSHVKAVPHVAEDGQVVGMYVVSHDITDVKQAQEKLAASEEELRFFAENIPEAIAYMDLERGCTFVNNLYLESRGLTREFALGKFPDEVFPPEVMKVLRPHLQRVEAGEETDYERFVRLPSGEERWVRVKVTPRRDATGRVRGYYIVSTDIHDIKTTQELLADKERQLRQVIDSIPTPMCYVDVHDRYRYVNDAFLSYIGLKPGEIVGAAGGVGARGGSLGDDAPAPGAGARGRGTRRRAPDPLRRRAPALDDRAPHAAFPRRTLRGLLRDHQRHPRAEGGGGGAAPHQHDPVGALRTTRRWP